MKNRLSRRLFLKNSLALTSVVGLSYCGFYSEVVKALGNGETLRIFSCGVASGDPTASSVVIWTRVDTVGEATVDWEVSQNSDFSNILRKGVVKTDSSKDHTVNQEVTGLKPGKTYFYRFKFGSIYSEPGRTKTLPVGKLETLGIAVVSCSNYPFGYFNVYDAIARDEDIDFVLHLGDYIYEYGSKGWGGATGQQLDRNHQPSHEIVSLADYRSRHKQYKQDIDSRLMHSMHPLIATWDDHESANNPWVGGAQNHQIEEGDWSARRESSVRAYYEWMPIRTPAKGKSKLKLWRHFEFGDLASMTTLETRHTGRSLQIDYSEHLSKITNEKERDDFVAQILGNPQRRMLSQQMRDFLINNTKVSIEKNISWNLLGNQIPMARSHVPDVRGKLKSSADHSGFDPVAEAHKRFEKLGDFNLPIYLDTWDGYPAAREELYADMDQMGANDLIVLTGDSHSFWANKLYSVNGKAMGYELGTTSVTSPGDFEIYGPNTAKLLDDLMVSHNQEILWTNCRHRGFIKLNLNQEKAIATYFAVDGIKSRDYQLHQLKTLEIVKQESGLQHKLEA